jgi:hypothetical protein
MQHDYSTTVILETPGRWGTKAERALQQDVLTISKEAALVQVQVAILRVHLQTKAES